MHFQFYLKYNEYKVKYWAFYEGKMAFKMQINILCAKLILVSVIALKKKLKNKKKLDIVKISVSNNVCVIITDLIPSRSF